MLPKIAYSKTAAEQSLAFQLMLSNRHPRALSDTGHRSSPDAAHQQPSAIGSGDLHPRAAATMHSLSDALAPTAPQPAHSDSGGMSSDTMHVRESSEAASDQPHQAISNVDLAGAQSPADDASHSNSGAGGPPEQDPPAGIPITFLGSKLFSKCVSGTRVIARHKSQKVAGYSFDGYGSHCDDYGATYLTAAAALGTSMDDVQEFLRRLHYLHDAVQQAGTSMTSSKTACVLPVFDGGAADALADRCMLCVGQALVRSHGRADRSSLQTKSHPSTEFGHSPRE